MLAPDGARASILALSHNLLRCTPDNATHPTSCLPQETEATEGFNFLATVLHNLPRTMFIQLLSDSRMVRSSLGLDSAVQRIVDSPSRRGTILKIYVSWLLRRLFDLCF
jgi:hypothetical protein